MIGKLIRRPSLNPLLLLKIYFHRVFRLIPAMAGVIIFVVTFWIYLGEGPIWAPSAESKVNGCRKHWWVTLTFLQEIINPKGACIGWTWYIANDMMYFLTLPFIVYAFCKKRIVGYITCLCLVVLCSIITIALCFHYHAGISPVSAGGEVTQHIYYKPWTRFGAYYVGVIFGSMYYEYKNEETYPRTIGTVFYRKAANSKVFGHLIFLGGVGLTSFLIWFPMPEYRNVYS
jgi:peptidoglycan/LPS O-acetylase OafA/YrhL